MNLAAALLTLVLGTAALDLAKKNPSKAGRPAGGRAPAERIPEASGIKDMAKIAPGIYRGGQPDETGFLYLKSRGFKTVVSLREHHGEKKAVEDAGMESIQIPLDADLTGSTPPTDAQIRVFFDAILDPSKQPVFFHCAVGKDRTGTMAALYRMEVDGWNADEALEEMRAFGAHRIFRSLRAFIRGYKPGRLALRKAPRPGAPEKPKP